MFTLFLVILALWAFTHFYLRGEDLSPYDLPQPAPFAEHSSASEGHREALASLGGITEMTAGVPRKQRLHIMRDQLDQMGDSVEFEGDIIPVDEAGMRGEWVVAPGADTTRRLLYIHGGAWMMGSPRSHRAITTRFALLTGGAVFSLDYRLLPEFTRQQGIDDCRSAYRWILENGPGGPESLTDLFVAGDSAGGNLALSLAAWVRDQGLRAPNGVVALSPATDATFSSPSMVDNVDTDHMLGPQFGKLNRVPRWIMLWFYLFTNRISPSEPRVSPAFGDLSALPPTLVHASEAEMLRDDAVRYVNKARASGSPVELQTWPYMLHVWHIFEAQMPEAREAFAEIGTFIESHRKSDLQAAAA